MAKRIAVLIANDFDDAAYREPIERLTEAGHDLELLGPEKGKAVTGRRGEETVVVDARITDRRPTDYDAVLIPGGHASEEITEDGAAVDFVKQAYRAQKPIAAICHGPPLLREADLVTGRIATSWLALDEANSSLVLLRRTKRDWADSADAGSALGIRPPGQRLRNLLTTAGVAIAAITATMALVGRWSTDGATPARHPQAMSLAPFVAHVAAETSQPTQSQRLEDLLLVHASLLRRVAELSDRSSYLDRVVVAAEAMRHAARGGARTSASLDAYDAVLRELARVLDEAGGDHARVAPAVRRGAD